VKNIVYQVTINDFEHLKARIRDAVATVTPIALQTISFEVEYRLDIFVPPKEGTLKFIDKFLYLRKFLIFSLSNVTHK
jgi:hypothetical protein